MRILLLVGVLLWGAVCTQAAQFVARGGETRDVYTLRHLLVTNINLKVDTTGADLAAGDALTPMIELSNAVRDPGGTAVLEALTLAAMDDVAQPFTLFIMSQPIGDWSKTNTAVALANTHATNICGTIAVATGDWVDLGTNRVACFKNIGLPVKAATNSLFLYGWCQGTANHTNGMRATLAIQQD